MRKIKEVLRLKHQHGLSARRIALSCSVARSTVSEYLMRAEAAGLRWPLPDDLDDGTIERRLFPDRVGEVQTILDRPTPKFTEIHQELQSGKHVTLQLLWQEYKQAHPDGYGYSQFCEQYRKWAKKLDLALRQNHRAGEKLFVDYAGDTVPVTDPKTGEVKQAAIFVAVLGASNYTYAEATMMADLEAWVGSHVRAFEFFGGCPAIVVPDNLKAGVTMPNRYEPDLNPTYQELAGHYGVAVIPARVRKPKDKAKVESGVLLVERWILAALRKRIFFSIGELNTAIGELLEKLNRRAFRKMPDSRRQLFEQIDRPALQSLPGERYEFARWKWDRPTDDYHIEVDYHHYSVPSHLVGTRLEIRYTAQTVEVFHKGMRVASHARSNEVRGATTVEGHRPERHRRYLEWSWPRLTSWAANAGPATAVVVDRISNSAPHREQAIRSCLGLVRLEQGYGQQRLEAACQRAVQFNACSFKSVQSILKSGMDRVEQSEPAPAVESVVHENIRGAGYFDREEEPCHVH